MSQTETIKPIGPTVAEADRPPEAGGSERLIPVKDDQPGGDCGRHGDAWLGSPGSPSPC